MSAAARLAWLRARGGGRRARRGSQRAAIVLGGDCGRRLVNDHDPIRTFTARGAPGRRRHRRADHRRLARLRRRAPRGRRPPGRRRPRRRRSGRCLRRRHRPREGRGRRGRRHARAEPADRARWSAPASSTSAQIRDRWESSVIQVVARPLPGVERALVIAGSDKRGTIFGVYDVSEQIGVSPWYWWADVPVRHRDAALRRAPAGTCAASRRCGTAASSSTTKRRP